MGKEIVSKAVRVLCFAVGNTGTVPATNPTVSLHGKSVKEELGPKQRWVGATDLRKEVGDADFVPIKTFTEENSEEEFAIALSKRGFSPIKEIGRGTSKKFVVGFAFESGENFYLGGDLIRPIPIRGGRWVTASISARGQNRLQVPLYSKSYRLEVNAWDNLSLVRTEEG